MRDPNELKAALERLLAGTATDADRTALRTALATGMLITGNRAVAIGRNASDVIITTGDGNIVLSLKGADAGTLQEALSSIAPTRLHQVPPPPADFTGRKDELNELLTTIEHGGVTISGLQGLGGIGKTALALKLAEQLKPRYPDAQFYLDLKGTGSQPLTVNEALAHIVRAYHPAAKLPDSQTELHNLYLSVLEGQRALLLMDNAASAEQVGPLIPPAACVLLVTSRWHFTLPGLAAKNLDTLNADDARALLLAIAPRIDAWADEISRLCGYLPLALRLAAGSLAKYRNLKPADYVQRLQDTQQRLQLIEASLSLSYELLSDELQERWRLLAVFPDSFADDAAAAVWNVDVDQARHTLGELIAASMVEWNETADRYRLHDLARLFADAKLSAEERVIGLIHYATHYKDVLAAANTLYRQGGEALTRGLALFDLEWSNIQAGHVWVAAQAVELDENEIRLGIAYPEVGGYILHLRQHPREWVSWLEIALTAARRSNDRGAVGNALNNIGPAYAHLGDPQRAINFLEEALLIFRESGNHKSEGVVLGNLGTVYYELGENQRAIQIFDKRLATARELGDRRGEGMALGNLGMAYAALGQIPRAIQFYKQALVNLRELGDRRSEGITLSNLGNAYYKLSEIQHAFQCYEQHWTIVRQIGDRRGEGRALWGKSRALDRLGKRTEAIQAAEQSLSIYEQFEDPNAAKVRAQLAIWREESGDD